jgi:NADPH-dependent ferric siderophore reductase
VMGFEKQNDGANGSFDEFWGTKGFDQYIKTCMWTKKNNKGAKITKKAPILKGTVSTDKEEILEIEECTGDPEIAMLLEEISYHLTPTQQAIVTMVVKDPNLIKPSGKMNIKQIAEALDLTWFETDKQIKSLSMVLENEL